MVLNFAEFQLDIRKFQLLRTQEPVSLEPKILQLLIYLIQQRGRLIEKEEILNTVWQDQAVCDAVLPTSIASLRRLLGDTRIAPRFIATVYGRGYRFIANVTEVREIGSIRPISAEARADSSFVGRVPEFETLEGEFERAVAGEGRIVFVAGEPGIGKTRICKELALHAGARGMQVRFGRGLELEGAPSLRPWQRVLQQSLREATDAGSTAWLKGVAGEVERILRPSPSDSAGCSGDVDLEASEIRFGLFEAVATLLEHDARRTPLALFFDDIHRWDDASLLLLQFLANDLHEMPIMVLATYREADLARSPSRRDLVATIAQRASAMTLSLPGLSIAEVASFVRKASGRSVAGSQLQRIKEATGGNPFFLTQLVPLLSQGLNGSDRPFSAQLPLGAHGAIQRHLAGLTSECRDMLRIASVAGQELEAESVATAVQFDRGVFRDTLNEATTAGVLLESRNGQTFRFAHGLLRDVLYESISEFERARLQRLLSAAELSAESAPSLVGRGEEAGC